MGVFDNGFSKAVDLIKDWLTLKIKERFDEDVDLKDDLIFHNTIDRSKIHIGKTYTEQITDNEPLMSYLDLLIDSQIGKTVSLEDMQQELEKTQ